jgi:WD40 repeat protein
MTMPTAQEHDWPLTHARTPIQRVFGDLRFHTDGELAALAFASDEALWSVEDTGFLRKWHARTGQQQQATYLSDVETLWVFSADARLLASASDDVSFWDVAGGRLVKSVPQAAWVSALAFGPQAALLATGHDDGMVRLWDAAKHELVRELKGHRFPISAAAFSPDGARLASASEDRTILLWDVASGQLLGTLQGHTDRVQALAWHPQGQCLVSAGWDTTARVWDRNTCQPIILLNDHADQVTALAFNRDGSLLACADSANKIHLWDALAGQARGVLQEHEGEIRCLAFSPDGRCLASGDDRVIHLWDPAQRRLISGRGNPQLTRSSVAVSPDGRRLASSCGGASVQVWDTATGQVVLQPDAAEPPPFVAYSPDGTRLAGGGNDNRIFLWDAQTGALEAALQGQAGRVAALAFAPDGQTLASASASDGTVWLWDLRTQQPCLIIPEAADNCTVEALAFDPQGRLLAAGGIDWLATSGADGAIGLWDVGQRRQLSALEGGTVALAFHPSGRYLAAPSLDDSVFVWDVEAQEVAAELLAQGESVVCVAYAPDGRWLAAGCDDGTLLVWDTAAHERAATHRFHTPLKALCFSPDSRFLYTANGNTTSYQLDVRELLN